ncbi:MAG: cytochrome c3 family protein [Rhodocyclaceae bacterium]|nr:cytochrome c3 family protein [Rhodocyclaceae bacterium]
MILRRIRHALVAGALGGLGLWVTAQMPGSDPLAERDCGGCHVSSGSVDPARAGVLRASQEALCTACHGRAAVASHPTGVQPSMAPVADYPLDWKGELTCSSCHHIHGTHGEMRGERRRREFCLACHDDGFFERMADGGRSLVVSAHLESSSLAGAEALLDPFSAQCMDCHGERGDGAIQLGSSAVSRHGASGVNHPVGVAYEKGVRFGGFRAQAALDPSIELPGGLVSCISCHRGYSQEHGAIRRAPRNGGLCLECHDL